MPIIVRVMLDDLITEIDDHLAWREAHGRKMAETTFGFRAVRDGKLMGRLRAGNGITVSTMQAIQAWIETDRSEILAGNTGQGAQGAAA